jgi:hypothetical protein
LVARLAGSADRPSYTTGPATRRALAEAGALGATTGTVVHLPARPGTDPAALGVLAHELSHARQPVGRPRFLLGIPSGAADADERTARSVGQRVGGGLLGATSVGTAADQGSAEAHRFGDQAGAMSAGVVDRLPVGGGAAAATVANGLPANEVPDAPTGSVPDGAPAALAALLPLLNRAENAETQTAQAVEHAAGAAGDTAHSAENAAGQTAAHAAGTAANQVPGQLGQGADLDRIVEKLEQRVLRQLERRGGRYAGVF